MTSPSSDSILERSDVPWEGFGLNVRVDDVATLSNQSQDLNAQWVRIHLQVEDPGIEGIYYDDETFDGIWEQSENVSSRTTRFVYSHFDLMGSKFIFTAKGAPRSWLTANGTNELRGDALVAFARLFVSGILVHKKYGMPVHWVELLDEPSSLNETYIYPDNYVVLVQTFKSILAARLAPDVSDIGVMGPGLSCIMPKMQTIEPYIAAFQGTENILDAWSVHVLENPIDADDYNDGTFQARTYVRDRFLRTVQFMKKTLPGLVVYVTKTGTNATRYSQGMDYGPGAPETVEYALRLMDNLCGIVSGGSSMALSWFLNFKRDNKSLYRADGSRRPQCDALALLNKILLPQPTMYVAQSTSDEDQTLKIFIASGNSFGFVLSRPMPTDALGGNLTMTVYNPDWNAENSICTMDLDIFPNYISLDSVTKEIDVNSGTMAIHFSDLPYSCVVFGKGDVYVTPPAS